MIKNGKDGLICMATTIHKRINHKTQSKVLFLLYFICLKPVINKDQYYFQQTHMTDIQCVFESMAGKGSIFISNFAAAQDMHLLQSKGIKAILSVARSGLLHHTKEEVPYYLYLPAQDHEDYEIYKYFNQTFDFIEQARKNTNVLVHCMAGVSRSVTIVIAYLLKKFKCSLGQVIRMLQRKRSKINPNKGFIEQLKKYAQQQGLKCNFDYEQVPVLKEKTQGRNRMDRSKSKEMVKERGYILTNPLAKHKDKIDERSTFQKTINTKEDISQYSKKSQELKPILPERATILNAQENIGLKQKSSSTLKAQESVILKKRFSCDTYSPDKKIEEKIIKVRERILMKQKIKKSLTLKKQPEESLEKNQNKLSLKLLLEHKKHSNKQLTQYFSLCHKSSNEEQACSYLQHRTMNGKQKCQQFYINVCETDGLMLSKGYRKDSRNLHSKLYPRKVNDKSIC